MGKCCMAWLLAACLVGGLGLASSAGAALAGGLSATRTSSAGPAANRTVPAAGARPAAQDKATRTDQGKLPQLTIGPRPAWVQELPVDDSIRLPAAAMHYAVIDEQTRLGEDGETRFSHVVRVVDQTAGLERAAQITIEFDPSYQTLVFHQLRVVRGGLPSSRLDLRHIEVLHREMQLERQMIDGRRTASIVLEDLRVGDRIDYAYSIHGANPVFGGRFVDESWVSAWLGPVGQYRYRLLAPLQRVIRHRARPGVEVTTRESEGVRETVAQAQALPQMIQESNTPPIWFTREMVQWSEFPDWASVADWAAGLFATTADSSPALRAQAVRIRAASADPVVQLGLALDFVQQDIRYFGTEIGASSHRPAPPAETLLHRYGDCKDKVVLLTALLRELGIAATPAVVSTGFRGEVDTLLPSPLDFDHAILRVTVGDAAYWLDGTRAYQHGPVRARQTDDLGLALLATPGNRELTPIPAAPGRTRIEVIDRFAVEDLARDPQLESRIAFTGDAAELARSAAAERTLEAFSKSALADYTRFYPGIEKLGEAALEESDDDNRVTLVAHFVVHDFWTFPDHRQLQGDFVHWSLLQHLQISDPAPRRTPVQLLHAGVYRQSVRFDFSEDVFNKEASTHADDPGKYLDLGVSISNTHRHQQIDAVLVAHGASIPPEDWPAYRERCSALRGKLGNGLRIGSLSPAGTLELQDLINRMNRDIGSGALKLATRFQGESQRKLLVAQAQLDSKRLTPRLRAEVLVDQGIALDHLGRLKEAAAAFQEALGLVPDSLPAQLAAAENAVGRGDTAQAIALSTKVLADHPTDRDMRMIEARAEYLDRRYGPAAEDLRVMLKDPAEVEQVYPAIWLSLALAGVGGPQDKAALDPFRPASATPPWPYPVLQLLSGEISLEQARSLTNVDGASDPGRLCELYFYAAEQLRTQGDLARAREYYQRAIDTGVTEFIEYAYARLALDRLPTAH